MSLKNNPVVINDGELTYEDPKVPKQPRKGYEKFERKTKLVRLLKSYDRFTLTPTYNSDYKFTINKTNDSRLIDIMVYTVNGNSRGKKVKPNQTVNNTWTYSLEAGKTYEINVYQGADSINKYTFQVEQDNWVYAPEGGKWVCDKGNGSLLGDTINHPYESIYISQCLLYEAAVIEKGSFLKNEAAINAAMKALGYDKEDYIINKQDWTLTILGLSGFVAMVYQIGTGGGFIVMLRSAGTSPDKVAFLVGTASTTSSLAGICPILDKKLREMEYDRIKYILMKNSENIVCSHLINSSYWNTWDEWEYPHYINKYILGYHGKITTQIKTTDVISFCRWTNPQDV